MGVTAYGKPLQPLELPVPKPPRGHARLEVLTCGVCFSDVKTARGRMPFSDTLTLPHVPGHEICARVAETNPPGAMAPGTVVVVYHLWPCRRCDRCRAGEENLCMAPEAWTGFTDPGGFQEQLVAPIDRLVPVPAGIDPVHAAPLTCALGTAYRAVVTRAGARPGSSVVIVGLGGVGIHALQVAAVAGARAVGVDVSQRAVALARDLGLSAIEASDLDLAPEGSDPEIAPDARDLELARALPDLLGGDSADAVVDTVGTADSLRGAERLVRPGGRIVAVGYALDRVLELPLAPIVLQEKELLGSRYVRMDELERAIGLVADGRVRIVVDRVEPLERANEGLEALEAGEVAGRVVFDVAGVT